MGQNFTKIRAFSVPEAIEITVKMYKRPFTRHSNLEK